MANKYTFTYEFAPNSGPKTATVVVVEDAENIEHVLSAFKNFLSGSGFAFAPGYELDIVNTNTEEKTEES
jgi:hypothetical protein